MIETMTNININDLESSEIEMLELSELELNGIIGGGWFERLTGIRTPKILKGLDDLVNKIPGGWPTIAKPLVKRFGISFRR